MEMLAMDIQQACEDYARIEIAIQYLESHADDQPDLAELAAAVNLSEYHFQRLFTRWAGVSPKRFLQFLTKERAKQLLAESHSLMDVSYRVGLSGPGRLHDLFVSCEAVTPGDYKRKGEGLAIRYGYHATVFGECLLACTELGITDIVFIEQDRRAARKELAARWPRAELVEDPAATQEFARQISAAIETGEPEALRLHLVGTNFQMKVWEALLTLPAGTLVSYQDLAVFIGTPDAPRAVGAALSANPIPVIIPCHRVIQKNGNWGGYRYGSARKKALLGWEQAHASGIQAALA